MIRKLRFMRMSTLSETKVQASNIIFDPSIFQHQTTIPSQFIWPENEKPSLEPSPPLDVPVIDLSAFHSGDPSAISKTISLVDEACKRHGFFFVVNHGIDSNLINEAKEKMHFFFGKPLTEKKSAQRKVGENYGYADSFTNRFSAKLPWKETLSFPNCGAEDYITNVLGEEFRQFGKVYQKYCDGMSELSLQIMEVLGISLGLGKGYFREFFEGHNSVLRLNNYPRCQKPDQTLGTGPHCDPVALTVLYQDESVNGLEVHVDGKWHSVPPKSGALIVNIGDVFMALSNGIYKSCLHRAVVNNHKSRISIAFFMSPAFEKIVEPPQELLSIEKKRVYPDFTWETLLKFTQTKYRSDVSTLDSFVDWIKGKKVEVDAVGA